MAKNIHLKTSNTLLNSLNEKYFVIKHGVLATPEVKNTYDVYTKYDAGGIDYVCSLVINPKKKKCVTFNEKVYCDEEELLKDVEQYNSTLTFPPRMYDPMFTLWAREQSKIHWYLTEVLKFKPNDSNGYSLRNMYGEVLFSLNFEMDSMNRYARTNDDTGSGMLIRRLSNGSWINSKFTDAEDAISQINTLVLSEIASNINNDMDTLLSLTGSGVLSKFSSMTEARVDNFQSFLNGQTEKYADKVLPLLKQLVTTLEEK